MYLTQQTVSLPSTSSVVQIHLPPPFFYPHLASKRNFPVTTINVNFVLFTTNFYYNFTTPRIDNYDNRYNYPADAYKGYINIDKDNADINWAACWCHERRRFEELAHSDFRTWILKDIRKLFLHERVVWKKDSKFRLKVRNRREQPIVDRIFKKLKDKLIDPKLLPKSKLCEAIKYMLAYEQNFRFYLDHPDAKMDNNTSERALRKIARGRKNWMYLGSRRSGKAMANHISLIQSCRVMDINPQKYLEYIYRNLMSYPHKQLHELLPDKWEKMQKNKG